MNIEKTIYNETKTSSPYHNPDFKKYDSPILDNDNLFAYDIEYSEVFAKKIEQSDDDFFNTFNNLQIYNSSDKNFVKVQTQELTDNASIKEENFINKDLFKILDSPSQNVNKCSNYYRKREERPH
jgi:hypothetical protein